MRSFESFWQIKSSVFSFPVSCSCQHSCCAYCLEDGMGQIWGYDARTRLRPLKILSSTQAPVAAALDRGVAEKELSQLFGKHTDILIIEFEPHGEETECLIWFECMCGFQRHCRKKVVKRPWPCQPRVRRRQGILISCMCGKLAHGLKSLCVTLAYHVRARLFQLMSCPARIRHHVCCRHLRMVELMQPMHGPRNLHRRIAHCCLFLDLHDMYVHYRMHLRMVFLMQRPPKRPSPLGRISHGWLLLELVQKLCLESWFQKKNIWMQL